MSSSTSPHRRHLVTLLAVLAVLAAACSGGEGEGAAVAGGGCDEEITQDTIEVWWHEGAEAEVTTVEDFVAGFNDSQEEVTAELTLIPEADYASALSGAAASGDLPDVVDMDASFAFNYAWSGDLQPIGSCIPDDLMDDLLPSIVEQGTYADRIWAVGMFDAGLGIYGLRSALEEAGVRIPETPEDAWTVEEFDEALVALRDFGFEQPLDVKKNYGQGEYYSFLNQPFVWSAGGDLLNDEGTSADGELNTPEVVEAFEHVQGWHTDGFVDDNEDDAAFTSGRSALSMAGHWEINRYSETFGEDLVIMPLPDFGEGTRSGQGSWQWAVGAGADADAAWSFIEYTLQPEQNEVMAEASGGIPSRASVAAETEKYGEGGLAELFLIQLEEGHTVPRPPHPAYPTISSAFNQAMQNIIDGADVQQSLDEAVETIDSDIEANEGYPPPE